MSAADSAITDYTESTEMHGDMLAEVVDLRQSAAADQNRKMQLGTLFDGIITYDDEVVCFDGDVVYL